MRPETERQAAPAGGTAAFGSHGGGIRKLLNAMAAAFQTGFSRAKAAISGFNLATALLSFAIFAMLALSAGSASAMQNLLSLQGNAYDAGSPINNGNLTVVVWNQSSGGGVVYNSSSDFVRAVNNGQFDVVLGNGSQELVLEYGRLYYMDMEVNGQDLDFNGSERRIFQSSVGNVSKSYVSSAGSWSQAEIPSLTNAWAGTLNASRIVSALLLNVNSSLFLEGFAASVFFTNDSLLASMIQNVNSTHSTAISGLQADNATQAALITAKAAAANCPVGEFVQNTTTGGVQCAPPAGGGTVTSVVANASGLLGGDITGAGTISLNYSHLNTVYLPIADQRYNETSLISGKLDVSDQRYNETALESADNTTQAALISGLLTSNTTQAALINTKLDASDQRYNETALESADNTTQAALISGLLTSNTTQATAISGLQTDNTTQAALINAKAAAANCPAGQVVQNTTTGGVQCISTGGVGTVTEIIAQAPELTGGTITSSGTIAVNLTRFSEIYLNISDQRYNESGLIGGKLDASDQRYNETGLITGLQADNTTQAALISGLLTSNTTQATAISGLQTDNTTQADLISGLFTSNTTQATAISGLQADNTTQAALIASRAFPGDCPAGQVVQNTTTGGVECITTGGSGTVTSVVANASGLLGGDIQTSGTISLNYSHLNTVYLPIVDQRYNETSLISGKLDVSDQRYNETALESADNTTQAALINARLANGTNSWLSTLGVNVVNTAYSLMVNGTFRIDNTSGLPVVFVNSTLGRMGVLTLTPLFTLDVNGTINATTISANTFIGNIDWTYLLSIPAYVLDYQPNITGLMADNTTQAALISGLVTSNTTQATAISGLQTDNTTQAALITGLQSSLTTANNTANYANTTANAINATASADNTTQASLISGLVTSNTTQAAAISQNSTAFSLNISRLQNTTQNLNDTFVHPLYVVLANNTNLTNERVLGGGTGIYTTDNGAGNSVNISLRTTLTLPFFGNMVWTNMPAAEGEPSTTTARVHGMYDFTNVNEIRFVFYQPVAGAAGSFVYLQYNESSEAGAWENLTGQIPSDVVAVTNTSWITLTPNMKSPTTYIRFMGGAGSGNADPRFYNGNIEVR